MICSACAFSKNYPSTESKTIHEVRDNAGSKHVQENRRNSEKQADGQISKGRHTEMHKLSYLGVLVRHHHAGRPRYRSVAGGLAP